MPSHVCFTIVHLFYIALFHSEFINTIYTHIDFLPCMSIINITTLNNLVIKILGKKKQALRLNRRSSIEGKRVGYLE